MDRLGKRVAASLLVVLLVMASPAAAQEPVGCAEGWLRTHIVNGADDFWPRVSGDRIAWPGRDSDGHEQIFTWTPQAGVVQVSTGVRDKWYPQVCGDRIVWQGQGGVDGGEDWEIFTWTPASGLVQLTVNSWEDTAPQVSGDRVVWMGEGGTDGGYDQEIFSWTPTTGLVQVSRNDTDDLCPQVSGHRIVWFAYADWDNEIFTWTPDNGIERVTYGGGHDGYPQVSGDRIVWEGAAGGYHLEVFTWTPETATVRVTNNEWHDMSPQVSGDRIVWQALGSASEDDSEVFTWTPSAGATRLTHNDSNDERPEVDGDRIVWMGYSSTDFGTDWEVFTWTPSSGAVQLTMNAWDDWYPHVSGDRVVCTGAGLSGDYDIYTYTLADPIVEPPVPPVEPPGEPGSGTGPFDGNIHITADVAAPPPSLTFTVSPGAAPAGGGVTASTLAFGTLAPATPKTGSHYLGVSTNAVGGYLVTAAEAWPLRSEYPTATISSIPDVSGDDGSITHLVSGPWSQSSTYGFGYTLANRAGSDAVFTTGFKRFADLASGQGAQAVMTSSAPVVSSETELTYKVNISATQPQGAYATTVTYVATGNF